jgi:glyoxylase-like metal-dependent hydrolase (beta-lactamase superfamily II)
MSSIFLNSGVRVHAIQTGTVAIKQLQRDGDGGDRRNLAKVFVAQDWTEPLPIFTYLIEHPERLILVDTGETARVNERGYFPAWHPYYRFGLREWVSPEQEVGPQLRELGFEPDDIDRVVLTHFHTDHVGGLFQFPSSDVITSERDYRDALGVAGRARGFLPQHLPDSFSPTFTRLVAEPVGPFGESMPLTQAGDVRIVPTPGHTPGHLSVVVEDHDGTVFFFASDASYTEQHMLDGRADGVSPDPAAARRSLAGVRELAQQRPTVYLPAHDPESVDRLLERRPTTVPATA